MLAAVRDRGASAEPEFAQTQEVASLRSPDVEAAEAEVAAIWQRVETLQRRIGELEDDGELTAAKLLQSKLDAELAKVAEIEASGPMLVPVPSPGGGQPGGYLSLSDALRYSDESGDLDAEGIEARVESWRVFLRYIFHDGAAHPGQAFRNLLAATRRANPELLGGISGTALAAILGETRAATQAREKRQVEALLKRWDVLGFHLLGDCKGEATRAKLSAAQRGNTNRRDGAARKRAAEGKAKPDPKKKSPARRRGR